jgi:large subunit ribosomal protein L14e
VNDVVEAVSRGLVGMVVTSRAGRDTGDRYVVIAAAGADTVLVADGQRRGTTRPKRKNVKHLEVHAPAGPIAARLRDGGAVTDEELREALAAAPRGLGEPASPEAPPRDRAPRESA